MGHGPRARLPAGHSLLPVTVPCTCIVRDLCCSLTRTKRGRLQQPRMSLLGKPLNYRANTRRDARYRRLQSRVYNFLERPRGLPSIFYHIVV